MARDLPLGVETRGRPQAPETDTFLLLHGYGGSTFSWRYWSGSLERRGHVVLVDFKGFGSAPKPDDDAYGPHEQAGLVHRLILERDLRNLTVVGHSLGGGIALLLTLELLQKSPERLSRLVLLAGAAYRQKLPPFVGLSRWPRLASFLLRLFGARFVVRTVLDRIVYDPRSVTRSQIEGYARPLGSAPARRALIRAGRAVLPDDLEEVVARYHSITIPTLLLWGRQDPVVPLWVGERLAATLPNARLEVMDRCGHLPAEEDPEGSMRILERFLDDTETGR